MGRDETIIKGISFSSRTKKLRLNYRNPCAVYAASLGLMFRWFASEGPKVIPTKDDLENGFGFGVVEWNLAQGIELTLRSDSHPGNAWRDCVAMLPSCGAAFAKLAAAGVGSAQVLWVRFCDEDPDFDYERLSRFTYHNLYSLESIELTDKYIKGQDFPIVVVEGFSERMGTYGDEAAEQLMWQLRRQLYVCTSRATCFLFFIGGGRAPSVVDEAREAVRQLSAPRLGKSRTWAIRIEASASRRGMDVFRDAEEPSDTTDAVAP